jgi:hypothetical protein
MEKEKIIEDLYKAFRKASRPKHFTDYKRSEECYEHDKVLLSATLSTLGPEHVGQSSYSPFPWLTAKGFAHYMPRVLELAITGAVNEDGDLLLHDVLFYLVPGEGTDRFKKYNKHQVIAIHKALKYAKKVYAVELKESLYDEDMLKALAYWGGRLPKKWLFFS